MQNNLSDNQPAKSIFSGIHPKLSFYAGLVLGLLGSCSVALILLLPKIIYSSPTQAGQAANVAQNPAPAADVAPNPNPEPSVQDIKLAAITPSDWQRGADNPKITIVEFSDPECPFCKRFHATMQQVMDEYGDKVKWVYKHAPLLSLHSKAKREAEAFECAGELGGNEAFWKFADRLFEVTPSNNGLADSELPRIASYIGLDQKKFTDCLDSEKYGNKVMSNLQEAESAGMQGTPYSIMVMGDQKIPINGALPYDQIKSGLDSLLN